MNVERSIADFARARNVIAGGVNSSVRAFKAVGGSPIFMKSGAGAIIRDVDGHEYVDYVLSWGPLLARSRAPGGRQGRLRCGGSRQLVRRADGSRKRSLQS